MRGRQREEEGEGGRAGKETAVYPGVCQSQSAPATSYQPVQNLGSQAQPRPAQLKSAF